MQEPRSSSPLVEYRGWDFGRMRISVPQITLVGDRADLLPRRAGPHLAVSLASLSTPQKARLQSLEASLGVSPVKCACFLLELFLKACLLSPWF